MPSSITPNPDPIPGPAHAPDPDQNEFERCKSNNHVGNHTLPNLICFLDFVIDVVLLSVLEELAALKEETREGMVAVVVGRLSQSCVVIYLWG